MLTRLTWTGGIPLADFCSVARPAELQIQRPHKFLKHERTAQRAGVAVLTVFVLAGAIGAFGDGPLSQATTEGQTQLTYDRFGRTSASTKLAISVETAAADGQPVRFRIERAFLADLESLEVRPPDALKALDETAAWFEVAASDGRGYVELHYSPSRPGVFQTLIAPEGAEPSRVWQFIYF